MNALEIIVGAYEDCNRLSPGEALSADDAAFGLRRLNLLVDELSAKGAFLFLNTLTSAAQTGPITLGVGAWAAIEPGSQVVSATANNMPMAEITMEQYNLLYQPATTGIPSVYALDGLNTVFMWPVPNGQTVKLQTRKGVQAFADQTADYEAPQGYKAALIAGLAVRVAPKILGTLPAALVRAERIAMAAIDNYQPAINDVYSFTKSRGVYPPRLFS